MYPRCSCYLPMTLYCVAPKEMRLKRKQNSGEGLWKTGGRRSVERKLYRDLTFNGDGNLDGNSGINLQGENLERATTFKYLGATLVTENVDLEANATCGTRGPIDNASYGPLSGLRCSEY